jgi:hypothetical protein
VLFSQKAKKTKQVTFFEMESNVTESPLSQENKRGRGRPKRKFETLDISQESVMTDEMATKTKLLVADEVQRCLVFQTERMDTLERKSNKLEEENTTLKDRLAKLERLNSELQDMKTAQNSNEDEIASFKDKHNNAVEMFKTWRSETNQALLQLQSQITPVQESMVHQQQHFYSSQQQQNLLCQEAERQRLAYEWAKELEKVELEKRHLNVYEPRRIQGSRK